MIYTIPVNGSKPPTSDNNLIFALILHQKHILIKNARQFRKSELKKCKCLRSKLHNVLKSGCIAMFICWKCRLTGRVFWLISLCRWFYILAWFGWINSLGQGLDVQLLGITWRRWFLDHHCAQRARINGYGFYQLPYKTKWSMSLNHWIFWIGWFFHKAIFYFSNICY